MTSAKPGTSRKDFHGLRIKSSTTYSPRTLITNLEELWNLRATTIISLIVPKEKNPCLVTYCSEMSHLSFLEEQAQEATRQEDPAHSLKTGTAGLVLPWAEPGWWEMTQWADFVKR